ncbi:MAG: thioredoxin domain-containing protein [Candidatus Diapherotrites archaeon]|nr:thioredoxin domain-containing protein [Candidatus Diapherotrites archaeon]
MVVCIVALPILLILGIFSATHRKLANEAIKCALRKVTFRPCDLSLEQKLKKMVFGSLMKQNEKIAFFAFKHFEGLSMIFGTLMVLSLAGTLFGAYNLALYGNCNGPATSAFCIFNPETYSSGIEIFGFRFFETVHSPSEVKPIVLGDVPTIGNEGAKIKIIEVGCFTCPYTKASEPLVKELLEKYGGEIFFAFKYFPLPSHPYSFEAAASAECAREQGKFWEYKEKLFEQQQECTASGSVPELNKHFVAMARAAGVNEEQFGQCIESGKYNSRVQEHKEQAIDAGIYGTPTFYVNGKVLVAPKTIEEFELAMQN